MPSAELTRLIDRIVAGDVDTVKTILRARPSLVNERDGNGATPLHHAAFGGRQDIMEVLLTAGADINARDDTYNATPTGWAAHFLRERGGLLAIEIDDALLAIERGDADWLGRFVTRHPALLTAVSSNGKTVAQHASESGNADIARIFSTSSHI